MLAEYFESPSRIQEIRGRPAGRLLEGFAQVLYEVGYAQLTARRHICARPSISFIGLAEEAFQLRVWKNDSSRSLSTT